MRSGCGGFGRVSSGFPRFRGGRLGLTACRNDRTGLCAFRVRQASSSTRWIRAHCIAPLLHAGMTGTAHVDSAARGVLTERAWDDRLQRRTAAFGAKENLARTQRTHVLTYEVRGSAGLLCAAAGCELAPYPPNGVYSITVAAWSMTSCGISRPCACAAERFTERLPARWRSMGVEAMSRSPFRMPTTRAPESRPSW